MKRLRASTATLLAIILVIASAHVVSELWVVQWMIGARANIILSRGTLSVEWIDDTLGGLMPMVLCTWPIQDDSLSAAPRRWLPAFQTRGSIFAAIPLCMVEVPLVALTIAQFRRIRKLRGRCPHCGYDRTGLAVGAVCPECGRREPGRHQKR